MKFFKELLQKNLVFFIVTAVLLLIVIGAGVNFASSLGKKYSLENKIEKEIQLLDSFRMTKDAAPTLMWIDYLAKKEKFLDKIYTDASSLYDKPSSFMPKAVIEPLKFKEKIFEKQKEMRKKVYANQLELKEEAISFGFREYETKIPTKDEVPNLTKELDVIEEIVDLMCSSHIETLSSVDFLNIKDDEFKTSKGNITYKVFPVKVSTISSIGNLVDLLFRISTSDYMFIVEELNVVQSEDFKEKVNSSFIVSCIVFTENNEK
jgi:hypothetical protein